MYFDLLQRFVDKMAFHKRPQSHLYYKYQKHTELIKIIEYRANNNIA